MNYDQPRQIADGPDSGKWHYTTANRRTGVHPIGRCADHEPHGTEQEARECYAAYLRDKVTLREHCTNWVGCSVKDCDNPARNLAESGPWNSASLCDDHFTREDAIAALGLDRPAGDSMHS